MRNDEQPMTDLNEAFAAGLARSDVEHIVSLYAEEGVYMPAGHPPVRGVDAIASYFRHSMAERGKAGSIRIDWAPEETLMAGNLVLQWGTYRVLRTLDGGPVTVTNGSQLLVARQRPDGSLELLWDIDNIYPTT